MPSPPLPSWAIAAIIAGSVVLLICGTILFVIIIRRRGEKQEQRNRTQTYGIPDDINYVVAQRVDMFSSGNDGLHCGSVNPAVDWPVGEESIPYQHQRGVNGYPSYAPRPTHSSRVPATTHHYPSSYVVSAN